MKVAYRSLAYLAVVLTAWGVRASGQEAPAALRMDRASAEELSAAWRPLFEGVDHVALVAAEPRLLSGQALRVDLKAPGIGFVVNPSNGERPLECDSITTSHFLEKLGVQAAINAAPFSPVVADEGVPQDVVGVAISRGARVSEPNGEYGALVITRGNEARIVEQAGAKLDDAENACGGFKVLIRGGEIVAPQDVVHPRSAVGISRDGRYLYLLVIDGRQILHSLGTTQAETAGWLKKLGAWEGLNLDGGGSTSLVVEGEGGKPRVLNRPIQSGVPGRERPCPNHLGVVARKLAGTR